MRVAACRGSRESGSLMGDDGEREAGEGEAGESEIIEFTDFETEERSQRRQRIADLERSWLAHRVRPAGPVPRALR